MKLAWATDVHFDHPDSRGTAEFCRRLRASGADVALIDGDIANGAETMGHLAEIRPHAGMPIDVVLGDHDDYGDAIESVIARYRHLDAPPLCWLPAAGCVALDHGLSLVGHGGWGDLRHGDIGEAPLLTDDLVIAELRQAAGREYIPAGSEERGSLQAKLQQLGDHAADVL